MPDRNEKAMFSAVSPLVSNARIVQAFKRHEAAAVEAKRRYHHLGRLGMALVLASTLYTVAEALIIPDFVGERWVAIAAIAAGLIGLGLQVYLYLARVKQRWLLARFAGERVRSIAFQAICLGWTATDGNELERAADRYYSDELTLLEMELNGGESVMSLFSPHASLHLPVAPSSPVNADLAATAGEAYLALRVRYQQRLAASELSRLRERRRLSESLSDFLYILGGCLAIAALTAKLFAPHAGSVSAWLDFVAVASFILGLSKSVFDGATISAPSVNRFERYQDNLAKLDPASRGSPRPLPELVRAIELAALEELSQFCVEANKISYRL